MWLRQQDEPAGDRPVFQPPVSLDRFSERQAAHLLLGSLHGEPILNELATSGPERLSAALRSLACSVLDAPAAARSGG